MLLCAKCPATPVRRRSRSRRRDPAAYTTARLIVMPPSGAEKSVVLGVPHVRIGAGSSNDMVIDDPHASRFHAELRKTDEGWLLRDLGSLNGTRVGDVAVKEGLLHSGATITVGETRIKFLADEGRAEEIAVSPRHAFGDVVGRSLRMREVFGVLERIAATDLTVLIGGETGSGKDVIARAIHKASPRAKGPFVVFDCAAVAPNLIESRAVRPRQRRLHRRRRQPRRRVRARAQRHAVPRRDRRAARSICSRSSCARSSSDASRRSAGRRRSPSTCASSRRRTATSSRR